MSGPRPLHASHSLPETSSGRNLLPGILACLLLPAVAAHGQARVVLNAGPGISTLAGNGTDGLTQGGPARAAALGHPHGLTYDTSGYLYVADGRNHQVSRIAPDGTLTILGGTGQEGYSGDSGPATAAQLSHPTAIVLRADGTLVIADTGNHRIRIISPDGIIATLAGGGTPGNSGDGGLATAAQLRRPAGIVVDATGNLLVADTGNHRIRRIAPNGTITAVAGNGQEGDEGDGGPATAATFRSPTAMLTLADGTILVADTAAHRIRSLKPDGTIAAFATGATLRRPEGLATGPAGDLLLSDSDLQQLLQTSPNGTGAYAGNASQGAVTSGPASGSTLDSPSSVATAADGSVALADRRNHQVQRITLPSLAFGNVPAGQRSAAQLLTVQNGGTSTLRITAVALPSAFDSDNKGTCNAPPFQLAAGAQCTISLVFQPQAQGAVAGIATITADTAPSEAVRLTGTAVATTTTSASTTTLTTNGTVAYAGAPVLLTATVSGPLSTAPAGNVIFMDGTATLSTVQLASSTASLSTTSLSTGQHILRAIYSGDASYAASTSPATVVTVVAAPDFTLSASSASYSGKTSATITVPLTCLPVNGTLNRPVSMAVTGLPSSFFSAFSPPVVTIAANPALTSLVITVPATVASDRSTTTIVLAAALLLIPFATSRRRRLLAFTSTAVAFSLAGCGGGFRTASSTTPTSATTHTYNITVTATATGILGDTLTHSIPVELVITP